MKIPYLPASRVPPLHVNFTSPPTASRPPSSPAPATAGLPSPASHVQVRHHTHLVLRSPGAPWLLPARLHLPRQGPRCVGVGGASALATRRPWRELGDPRALSVPRGLGDAYRRARANLAHFAMNYAIVVLGVVFLSLLWHPVSLIVFLACMVAWLFLYFLRDEPLALFGRAVGEGVVLAVLSAVTLVLLLLTGATANILTSLLVGLVLVLIHALLHRPADSIDEEAGRWYTPVPPQPTY